MALFNTLKQILTPYANKINLHTEEIDSHSEEIERIQSDVDCLLEGLAPEQYYYDHTFIRESGNLTKDVIVPCQSLFNVNTSYRLGFKTIEANVKALNDGNYIVCHGGGTKAMYFGNQFIHVDGTTDVSNIAFADVSLEWVRSNIRYRTIYDKYSTYPPTLEEFLYEVKKYNMTALIQCIDSNVVDIADSILGKNKWIAYNAQRSMTDGLLMVVSTETTLDGILTVCRRRGRPFMFCMGNTLNFSLSELAEIIKTVHSEGYLIGYVQYYVNEAYNQKYKELGFDFCASTWSVNKIDVGNICNLSGDFDFDEFVTNGVISNGVINLAKDKTITPANSFDSIFLGKGELTIVFTGNILVQIGGSIRNAFDSSDTPQVCISTFFLNEQPTFIITSRDNNTVISSISYKASKC